jgi:hypothetical protein
MVIYDTQFNVKYYDIEQELLIKCEKNKESEFSKQDVLDICDKLYRDELLSVFLGDASNNTNNNLIDNINTNIEELYNTILVNTQFKQLIEEVLELCFGLPKDSMTYMILYALFSYQLFHLTHKCICQYLQKGIIDITLFMQLKYLTIKLLSKSKDSNI